MIFWPVWVNLKISGIFLQVILTVNVIDDSESKNITDAFVRWKDYYVKLKLEKVI